MRKVIFNKRKNGRIYCFLNFKSNSTILKAFVKLAGRCSNTMKPKKLFPNHLKR